MEWKISYDQLELVPAQTQYCNDFEPSLQPQKSTTNDKNAGLSEQFAPGRGPDLDSPGAGAVPPGGSTPPPPPEPDVTRLVTDRCRRRVNDS